MTVKGITPFTVGLSKVIWKGSPKIIGRAHPSMFPQGVRPHSRGDFSKVKCLIFPRA